MALIAPDAPIWDDPRMSDDPSTIRAAAYVRVSTAQQAKGESLPQQKANIAKRAEYEGWTLVRVYEDAGRSGRTADSRPGLRALLADLDGIDRLIIPDLTRLARSVKDLANITDNLKAHAVDLVSLREGFDTSTAAGRLFFNIMAALGEFESERIAERLADFNARKVDRNLHNGGSRPFGYRFDGKGGLVIDEAEAAVVRRIFAEFNSGKSMRQIGLGLQGDGIDGTRGPMQWSAQRVRERLESVVYRGDLGSRLHDDVRPGVHEPIVSREEWAKAAARRDAQKSQTGGGRGRVTDALLPGGFLRCMECGSGMRPQAKRDSYRCSGRDEKHNGCEMQSIPRPKIDGALRDYFLTYVFDADASRAEYEAERARALDEAKQRASQAAAEASKASARREVAKRRWQDDELTTAEYRETDAELAAEATQAEGRAAVARSEIAILEADPEQGYEGWQELREAALGDLSRSSDRAALRAALQRIASFIGVGIYDPADTAAPLLDDVPTFEHDGRHFALWIELRPDAMSVAIGADGEPHDTTRSGLKPMGLPPMAGGDPSADNKNASAGQCDHLIRPFGLVRLPKALQR